MNRQQLTAVIHFHSKELRHLYQSIPGHFREADIHDWRVHYKKLRGFLRMVLEEFTLPPVFKHSYRASGEIRDIQLLQSKFSIEETHSLPVFLSRLNQQLFSSKEDFIRNGEKISFGHWEKEFNKLLPDYLTDERLKRFVLQKNAAINLALLGKRDDEALHTIRKHLKDLFYAVRLYDQRWGIPFPVPINRPEKSLEELTRLFGTYNDLTIQRQLITGKHSQFLPAAEMELLKEVGERWEKERKEVRGKLEEEV